MNWIGPAIGLVGGLLNRGGGSSGTQRLIQAALNSRGEYERYAKSFDPNQVSNDLYSLLAKQFENDTTSQLNSYAARLGASNMNPNSGLGAAGAQNILTQSNVRSGEARANFLKGAHDTKANLMAGLNQPLPYGPQSAVETNQSAGNAAFSQALVKVAELFGGAGQRAAEGAQGSRGASQTATSQPYGKPLQGPPNSTQTLYDYLFNFNRSRGQI